MRVYKVLEKGPARVLKSYEVVEVCEVLTLGMDIWIGKYLNT